LSNAKRRWIKENNPGLFKKVMGFRHWRLERAAATLAGVAGADSWDFRSFARDGGELWDVETGEEIAKPRKGNRVLSAFEEQQAAGGNGQATDGKTCCSTLAVACRPLAWTAVGNPFLLDAPLLVTVRISTATPDDKLAELVDKLGAKAERGAVLVSPWISPGEKAVKAEAVARGGRVVQLLAEGMGRYYKPGGADFDLCAYGRLLQLSPFAPRKAGSARESYGKARFEWLNLAAKAIGDLSSGFSRADLGRERTASVRQQGGGGQ
jgi:hypothetical protein